MRKLIAGLLLAVSLSGCGGAPTGSTSTPAFVPAVVADTQAVRPRTPGFPAQFQWGFATAGYQVEGGNTTSQWYAWEQAGHTRDKAGLADDFWNRYPQDLDMARALGANGFRVSIEWSRIEPQQGQFDQAAIQHYRQLIDAITSRGMTPVVTLLHFSFPQWLSDAPAEGNLRDWENPATVGLYVRYVQRVVQELGPSVRYYLTFNEPNIWVPGAYLLGQTPPGRKSPLAAARAVWNVLQAHGKAYEAIHKLNPGAQVSANVYQIIFRPFIKTAMAGTSTDIYDMDWFNESLQAGKAPLDPRQLFPDQPQSQVFVSLLGKFDYVAFDYYYPTRNIHDVLTTTQFWNQPLYPQGIYEILMKYQRQFGKPMMIAENGMATRDLAPRADGWKRADHLVQHLHQVQRAVADGANVIGYYYWSLMDNYEWGSYEPRFGMYSVNVLTDPTLQRIPTPAAEAYRQVMAGGITPELLKRYPGPRR